MNKTYEAIRRHYQWPNMKRELEYVKRCTKCQLNKALTPRGKAPIEITTTAKQPFVRCALEIVRPLTKTLGNKYIITLQDDPSKYLVAVPIPQQDSETIPKAFVLNI